MYELGTEEIEAVIRVLNSRKLFRYQGKDQLTECSSFEREFSSFMNSPYVLLVTSGTNALLNALKSAGIGEGDEVLIPCFTFVATPAAVIQAGAKPVLVNIDESLTLSVEDLEAKITARTKAILPVHMDGLPCDMEKIMAFAQKNKLLVIEDVAQATGGSFRGKKLGTFGFAGCFSFNTDKIITAGEGGVVLFRSEEDFKRGILFHDPAVSYGATFKDYLKGFPPVAGISMRVSELTGAILREQLKRLDHILLSLRERKKIFLQEFEKSGVDYVRSLDPEGDCGTSIHVRINNPLGLDVLLKELVGEKLYAYPIAARPAHVWWQWLDLLTLDETAQKEIQRDLSGSKVLLASLMKVHILPEWTLEETRKKAQFLVSKIK